MALEDIRTSVRTQMKNPQAVDFYKAFDSGFLQTARG